MLLKSLVVLTFLAAHGLPASHHPPDHHKHLAHRALDAELDSLSQELEAEEGDVTDLDKDEAKSTLAIEKMITQWTQWETSSGIRDAIQAREEAKKDAIKLGPLAQIDPILRGVKELLRAVPEADHDLLAE